MPRNTQSPRDKYMTDPEYRRLVDTLEQMIEHAHFTPSELREASLLASINYEMRHVRERVALDPRLDEAIRYLDREFVSKPQRRGR